MFCPDLTKHPKNIPSRWTRCWTSWRRRSKWNDVFQMCLPEAEHQHHLRLRDFHLFLKERTPFSIKSLAPKSQNQWVSFLRHLFFVAQMISNFPIFQGTLWGFRKKMTEVVSYNTLIKAFAQRANYTAACEALREKNAAKSVFSVIHTFWHFWARCWIG